MAVVLDEYGGHAGIVTLRTSWRRSSATSPTSTTVWGRGPGGGATAAGRSPACCAPTRLRTSRGIELPEHDDYDTIAGLIVQQLGGIAQAGDTIDVELPVSIEDRENGSITRRVGILRVDRMDGLRVDRLTVTVREEHEADGDE